MSLRNRIKEHRAVKGLLVGWTTDRKLFLQVMFVSVAKALVPAIELWMSMRFVNAIVLASVDNSRTIDIIPSAMILGFLFGVDRVLIIYRQNLQAVLAHAVDLYVTGELSEVMARVDLSMFDDPEWHDRMERARRESPVRAGNVAFAAVDLVTSLVGFVAMFALLASLHPLLIVLTVVPALPLVLAQGRASKEQYAFTTKMIPRDRERFYISDLMARRATTKEIRAFGLDHHFMARYRAYARDRLAAFRAIYRRANVLAIVGGLGTFVVLGFAYWFIGSRAMSDQFSAGALVAAIGAFAGITLQTTVLSEALLAIQTNARYLDDYFVCVNTKPQQHALPVPLTNSTPLASGLVMKGITFSYPNGMEVLKGIDLVVNPGELVAIVGDNGAGKSTIVNLILKLYEPSSGELSIGGIDLRQLEARELRSRIGVLFQDFSRYEFTVGENVHLGRVEDEDRGGAILAALDAAGATPVLRKLRNGLQSQLGHLFEGGQELSGGEWQRVALARLMYRRADLWILDEPTSHLDPEAEAELFAELKQQLAGRMAIVISHRFSSARAADRICVIRGGRVIESGSHDELVALGGCYATLFATQAAGYR